jgi:5'-nucleotidase
VLKEGLPDGICLNVNIPAVKAEEIRGIRLCKQANGFWKEEFEKRSDPMGREYYWLTGFFQNREPNGEGEGTDELALKEHYVSVVPVDTDLTAYSSMEKLKSFEMSLKRHEN